MGRNIGGVEGEIGDIEEGQQVISKRCGDDVDGFNGVSVGSYGDFDTQLVGMKVFARSL